MEPYCLKITVNVKGVAGWGGPVEEGIRKTVMTSVHEKATGMGVKSMYCLNRGPGFNISHPPLAAHKCSREF